MSNIPGHYHAEGDPPDTVRYWDGTQWVGDPMPAPPTASTPPPRPPGGGVPGGGGERYGTVGIRIGAALLDGIIGFIVILVLVGIFFGTTDGDGFTASAGAGESFLIGIIFYLAYVAMVAQFGGTPGKLILGLRITEADGETPVAWRGAFMRTIPGLLGNLPFIGWLISLGVAIGSIVTVSNDAETRQSLYDRIGNTRVVYAKYL